MLLYRITNSANGKAYIGITCRPIRPRFLRHLCDARNKQTGTALHAAVRKHGAASFSIEQIGCAASVDSLKEMERAAIAIYATASPTGYNMSLGGDGAFGYRKGVPLSADHRAKLSAAAKRRSASPEARADLSARSLKLWAKPGARAMMAAVHQGKPLSESHRASLSKALIGRPRPADVRAKIAAAHIGKTMSRQHREKLAESGRAYWRKRKEAA